MGLVNTYSKENGNINFYDDYCVKTKEEINMILNSVSDIYSRFFSKYPDKYIENP